MNEHDETVPETNVLRSDKAQRYADINPKLGTPNPISVHPREVRFHELIERHEVMKELECDANYLAKMLRNGVLRKGHPELRSHYLWRDVAALASTPKGSKEREEMEARLRLRNTSEYMLDFVTRDYYDFYGNPREDQHMLSLDLAAREKYHAGLADTTFKFRSLLQPVPYAEARDHLDAHDVQFLYLYDEEVPKMTTALEMRRWYSETHPGARYHVGRIAIPPLEYLNHPQHRGVLKFLVQAASILFHVELETMPLEYYEMIMQHEQKLAGTAVDERLSLSQALTGARISDESELLQLLISQEPDACLPLYGQVAAWYQAYKSLVGSVGGEFPEFRIKRQSYIESLLSDLPAAAGAVSLLSLTRQVETALGCHADWATKYRPEAPPVYIGQPPGYAPAPGSGEKVDPLRRNVHTGLRGHPLPGNLAFLAGQNNLEHATPEHLAAAEKLSPMLDVFHKAIAEVLPISSRSKKDRMHVSRLFSVLNRAKISPRSLYLYPYRDAEELLAIIEQSPNKNLLLDVVVPSFKAAMRLPDYTVGTSRQDAIAEVPHIPTTKETVDPAVLAAGQRGFTESTRLDYAIPYAIEVLGFTEADIAGMTKENVLESFSESVLPSLDAFIAKASEGHYIEEPLLDIQLENQSN